MCFSWKNLENMRKHKNYIFVVLFLETTMFNISMKDIYFYTISLLSSFVFFFFSYCVFFNVIKYSLNTGISCLWSALSFR